MLVAQSLEDRFHAVTGRLNATHAELVDLTVEVLADPNIWGSWDCHTVDAFVAWQCGLQIAAARKVVQVARRVDDLPSCLEAFRGGLLSLDQMAPIARCVPWWADEEMCRQAKLMTVEQISRTASKYPWDVDIPKQDGTTDNLDRPTPIDEPDSQPDGSSESTTDDTTADDAVKPIGNGAPTPEPVDTANFWWDDQQRFHLRCDLDAASGSIIENALTEARDGLFQNGQADVDWADALLDVAERSLDTVETPARRSRFRVHIHQETGGTVTNATGCGIADAVADYMTCDSLQSEVHEVVGVPISVGRTQHSVPERTRRTVIHRDGGCRVPGCHDRRWLDVHHIIHWAHGGPTDTNNLIALCNKHHRTLHQGGLGITGDADHPNGVKFTNRHGQPIRASGTRPKPPGEIAATQHIGTPYRPALRERLESRWQHFNPPEGFRPYWDHNLRQTINPRRHTN